ncbi:LysR substrate-binding domain-containing protein [Vibrio tapetis]|uniref:Putative Transcriptional regulator, LysR family protein n=1 Tax=Vibrio tapetis subsp. tapetis TaxID=1671868 RepID=A0A2N8ZC47_9VIBR|nr:LysR substrate-binding domain-containing protein [Vibrio tapetis]SON49486.1 putative Transcriptional regulator, LysR family protein [Vibrio tapetis subsp. tapetis]
MNISLKQLRVFVAITQDKTITAAAKNLFLSKAAVSMALAEMEKQIGHDLFDRVNNRLVLNQQGHQLLPLADELLHRAQDIDQLFVDDQPLHGQLHLGASDTIGNQVAPFLLRDFRSEHGHHAQSLLISNTSQICQKLVDYELDIALVEGKTQHPLLTTEQWRLDEMCIIAAPTHALVTHALTTQKPLEVSDLEGSDWILREAGSGSREFFLQRIAPRIDTWAEAFQLNTTEAIINAASANLGLACLSHRSAKWAIADGRVVPLNLPLDMQRRFWLLMHKERYQSPLLKAFRQFCLEWDGD